MNFLDKGRMGKIYRSLSPEFIARRKRATSAPTDGSGRLVARLYSSSISVMVKAWLSIATSLFWKFSKPWAQVKEIQK